MSNNYNPRNTGNGNNPATPITVVGNLGRNPEIRKSRAGRDWATFSVAHSDGHMDNGRWVTDTTTWYSVVCFGATAVDVANKLHKGDRVIIDGTVSTESWDDADGNHHSTLKITARTVGTVLGVHRNNGNGGRYAQSY